MGCLITTMDREEEAHRTGKARAGQPAEKRKRARRKPALAIEKKPSLARPTKAIDKARAALASEAEEILVEEADQARAVAAEKWAEANKARVEAAEKRAKAEDLVAEATKAARLARDAAALAGLGEDYIPRNWA